MSANVSSQVTEYDPRTNVVT